MLGKQCIASSRPQRLLAGKKIAVSFCLTIPGEQEADVAVLKSKENNKKHKHNLCGNRKKPRTFRENETVKM
jgi:hypothetical protein